MVHSFYSPLSISALFEGHLKLHVIKATQKGKKLKKDGRSLGIELGTSRTEGRTLTIFAILAPRSKYTY